MVLEKKELKNKIKNLENSLKKIKNKKNESCKYSINNKNCLMIEQDNPADMKEKLEKVLSDKELRDRLRKEGYKTAKQYGWPKITDKLEDFYKKVSS